MCRRRAVERCPRHVFYQSGFLRRCRRGRAALGGFRCAHMTAFGSYVIVRVVDISSKGFPKILLCP